MTIYSQKPIQRDSWINFISNLYSNRISFFKIIIGLFISGICGFDFLAKPSQANDFNYFFQRAYDKRQKGDKAGSIKDLNRAIELDSKQPHAYYNRGQNKMDLDDFYGAISDFEKAIVLDSSDPDSYWNLGYSFYQIKSYKNALKNTNKAISYKKNHIELLNLRGHIKYEMDDENGACEDWKKTVKLGDKDNNNWYYSDDGEWCRNLKEEVVSNKPSLGEVLSETPFMWKK